MKYEYALNHVLTFEGGYVNHPDDPGGETNFGISKRAYPDLDIKNLTLEKVAEIYLNDYWHPCRCDELPDELKLMVFDTAVNMGVKSAIVFLQSALGVKTDGLFGPITKKAIDTTPTTVVIDSFARARLERMTRLAHWDSFGRGWAKRVLDVSLICAFSASHIEMDID